MRKSVRRLSARVAVGLAALCLSGLAAWLGYDHLAAGRETGFLRWQDRQTVAAGQALYQTHCAACHGVPGVSAPAAPGDGQEPAPPNDESGHTWQHPDFALFQLVRDGVAVANCAPVDPDRMPMFRDVLSDSELVAVLSYIKAAWPEEIRQQQDRVNAMYGPYNRAVVDLIDIDPDR